MVERFGHKATGYQNPHTMGLSHFLGLMEIGRHLRINIVRNRIQILIQKSVGVIETVYHVFRFGRVSNDFLSL